MTGRSRSDPRGPGGILRMTPPARSLAKRAASMPSLSFGATHLTSCLNRERVASSFRVLRGSGMKLLGPVLVAALAAGSGVAAGFAAVNHDGARPRQGAVVRLVWASGEDVGVPQWGGGGPNRDVRAAPVAFAVRGPKA